MIVLRGDFELCRKKLYVLTTFSFAFVALFFWVFGQIAPEHYKNFDLLTKQNRTVKILDVVFWILITFNIVCVVWSTVSFFIILFKNKAFDKQFVLSLFLTGYPILLILAISSFHFMTVLKYLALPVNLLFGQLFGNYLY